MATLAIAFCALLGVAYLHFQETVRYLLSYMTVPNIAPVAAAALVVGFAVYFYRVKGYKKQVAWAMVVLAAVGSLSATLYFYGGMGAEAISTYVFTVPVAISLALVLGIVAVVYLARKHGDKVSAEQRKILATVGASFVFAAAIAFLLFIGNQRGYLPGTAIALAVLAVPIGVAVYKNRKGIYAALSHTVTTWFYFVGGAWGLLAALVFFGFLPQVWAAAIAFAVFVAALLYIGSVRAYFKRRKDRFTAWWGNKSRGSKAVAAAILIAVVLAAALAMLWLLGYANILETGSGVAILLLAVLSVWFLSKFGHNLLDAATKYYRMILNFVESQIRRVMPGRATQPGLVPANMVPSDREGTSGGTAFRRLAWGVVLAVSGTLFLFAAGMQMRVEGLEHFGGASYFGMTLFKLGGVFQYPFLLVGLLALFRLFFPGKKSKVKTIRGAFAGAFAAVLVLTFCGVLIGIAGGKP